MDPPTYPFEETSFMDGPLFKKTNKFNGTKAAKVLSNLFLFFKVSFELPKLYICNKIRTNKTHKILESN